MLALFMLASFLLGDRASQFGDRIVVLLLFANLAWSLLVLGASRNRLLVYRLAQAAIFLAAVDFALITVLLYLTSGADSPFFSPFIILILGATIQWGSRGALTAGLLTLLAFAPAGWQVMFGHDRSVGAAQVFVLRLGYTMVVFVMLMAFGRHVERVVDELSRLSDPLAEVDPEPDGGPPIRECLRHALWVFGAERGMFLWEEQDEPNATLTLLNREHFETRDLKPGGEDWVAPEAADRVFLFHRASGTTLMRKGGRVVTGPSRPIAEALVSQATFDRALVVPAFTPNLSGWVLIFDHDEPANEDLAVGAMVSAQVSVALERWDTQRTLRLAAAAEDRVRLARDLHDGVLQFLAGAGLQIDGLTRMDLPEEARARIATLRQAIADEQHELRGFISTLRPSRSERLAPDQLLGPELGQLADRLSRYWTIEVSAAVEPPDLTVPRRLAYDLGRIVRESVANAVRHGGAGRVRVLAEAGGTRLGLRIEDDGRGFEFQGVMPAEQIERSGGAPSSLHERVRALQGRLELRSSPNGATVAIDMPLGTA
ncbi:MULTISPECIES: histidine kinase [unclassified Phenylobacterium]|uniref:sensor histidine kinase n=1 Tax=unclassified Phenylobacterium TaxID=2640670 RepID=UPI0012E8564E|nr:MULTISPECIES: histidine kinase [unclassified Phenylobacterium]